MGGLDRRQRPADARGVAQVGRDRPDPGRRGLGVAGEAVDRPAARLQQVLGEVAAGDAGDAHDQRGRCHGLLPGPARGGPLAQPAKRGSGTPRTPRSWIAKSAPRSAGSAGKRGRGGLAIEVT